MTSTPKWYLPVAIVALLWNLLGCMAFISDAMLTKESIAEMSKEQQELFEARPGWALAATGAAVIGGALGCVCLIMRTRWSTPLLAASLLGVIVQDLALASASGVLSKLNPIAFVLQGIVLLIAIGLLFFSLKARQKGWIV